MVGLQSAASPLSAGQPWVYETEGYSPRPLPGQPRVPAGPADLCAGHLAVRRPSDREPLRSTPTSETGTSAAPRRRRVPTCVPREGREGRGRRTKIYSPHGSERKRKPRRTHFTAVRFVTSFSEVFNLNEFPRTAHIIFKVKSFRITERMPKGSRAVLRGQALELPQPVSAAAADGHARQYR